MNQQEGTRRISGLYKNTGNYGPPVPPESIFPGWQGTQFHPEDKKPEVQAKHRIFLLYSFTLIAIMLVFIVSSIVWMFPKDALVFSGNYSQGNRSGVLLKPTLTPSRTSTPLPASTSLPAPTGTEPIPPASTDLNTSTPPIINTSEPMLLPGVLKVPEGIEVNEKWIDVNVSSQTVYAMEGSEVINSFLVSTGKIDTLTVMGKFRVYLKFETASMRGEDYYYPEIPFVMYFYQGYGFHGVTWPLKLGVPTSHGCINMLTPDAEWLYNWAEIGTFINVHY